MKLSEIVAKLTGLESQVAADKFKGELAELQCAAKSTIAGLESDLAAANASIESLGKQKADAEAKAGELAASAEAFNAALNGAIANFKIEAKADATATEKLAALETFAKVAGEKASGIPADKIPAGGVKPEAKTITRAEFNQLSADKQAAFCKAGGKITE